jgi:hypothetical protein
MASTVSPINSFKERDKNYSVALCCDFPLRVCPLHYFGAALTQVCVLMPIGASNLAHFADGVSVRLCEQVATTKVPDLEPKGRPVLPKSRPVLPKGRPVLLKGRPVLAKGRPVFGSVKNFAQMLILCCA